MHMETRKTDLLTYIEKYQRSLTTMKLYIGSKELRQASCK